MTKGQLLALDTPERIKRQFGVGYKVLVEPKTDKLSYDDFINLKKTVIDNIIETFKKYDLIENHESSSRRAIY